MYFNASHFYSLNIRIHTLRVRCYREAFAREKAKIQLQRLERRKVDERPTERNRSWKKNIFLFQKMKS